jgi:hypothetical protein
LLTFFFAVAATTPPTTGQDAVLRFMRQLLDGQEQCSRMKLMLVRPEMKSINNSHNLQ